MNELTKQIYKDLGSAKINIKMSVAEEVVRSFCVVYAERLTMIDKLTYFI